MQLSGTPSDYRLNNRIETNDAFVLIGGIGEIFGANYLRTGQVDAPPSPPFHSNTPGAEFDIIVSKIIIFLSLKISVKYLYFINGVIYTKFFDAFFPSFCSVKK